MHTPTRCTSCDSCSSTARPARTRLHSGATAVQLYADVGTRRERYSACCDSEGLTQLLWAAVLAAMAAGCRCRASSDMAVCLGVYRRACQAVLCVVLLLLGPCVLPAAVLPAAVLPLPDTDTATARRNAARCHCQPPALCMHTAHCHNCICWPSRCVATPHAHPVSHTPCALLAATAAPPRPAARHKSLAVYTDSNVRTRTSSQPRWLRRQHGCNALIPLWGPCISWLANH